MLVEFEKKNSACAAIVVRENAGFNSQAIGLHTDFINGFALFVHSLNAAFSWLEKGFCILARPQNARTWGLGAMAAAVVPCLLGRLACFARSHRLAPRANLIKTLVGPGHGLHMVGAAQVQRLGCELHQPVAAGQLLA